MTKRQHEDNQQESKKVIKDRMLNVKLPNEDYEEMQKIAREMGTTLSGMVRILLIEKLTKVRNSKNPKDFIN
jgi:antitoxin component of RelBE/YafQ-DinJ toxin-antitoxin module